jgi:hypothetical protein
MVAVGTRNTSPSAKRIEAQPKLTERLVGSCRRKVSPFAGAGAAVQIDIGGEAVMVQTSSVPDTAPRFTIHPLNGASILTALVLVNVQN